AGKGGAAAGGDEGGQGGRCVRRRRVRRVHGAAVPVLRPLVGPVQRYGRGLGGADRRGDLGRHRRRDVRDGPQPRPADPRPATDHPDRPRSPGCAQRQIAPVPKGQTMTTTDPDQIRQEIERTRAELSDDVNALTYKVSPRRVVGERVDRARGTFRGVKERIMGTASDVTDSAGDRMSSTASSVRDAASTVGDKAAAAPQVLREKTEGSPLAAGLVAFGVGLVISSLIPPTDREQRLAGQVKEKVSEHSDELKERATQIGQEVKENLREPAQQAVESVKSTVSEATDTVKEQGRAATQDVTSQTQEARDN